MERPMHWRARAAFVVTALVCVSGLVPLRAEQFTQGFPSDVAVQLARNKEIHVATERKDGTRSDAAPVWFALIDNAIWFSTSPDSHKAERIARGSPVYVSVLGKNGPFIKTKAEISKDGAIADQLGEIYAKKYWMAWLGLFRPSRARVESGKIVLVRLTPAP
jgi:hypothetical protein